MKRLMDLSILLPIGIIVVHLYLILSLWIFILKRLRFIQKPLSGVDYSQALFVGFIIISALIIGVGEVKGHFQVYRTYTSQDGDFFMPYLAKSSQFFIVVLFVQLLLGILIWGIGATLRDFGVGFKEIREGNLPFGILMGVIILGCSFILRSLVEHLIDLIVPRVIIFN